jgi:type I restriction enzyme R subunit
VPDDGEVINSDGPQAAYGMKEEERISKLVALTQHVFIEIERELSLTGFWDSIPARQKLVESLQKILLQPEFAQMPGLVVKRKHIISRLMETAKTHHDAILYAQ